MSSPVTRAMAGALMLRDVVDLLTAELGAELAAAQSVLQDETDSSLTLPAPLSIRSGHFDATRDALPMVTAHVMEARGEVIGSLGQDTVSTSLRIYAIVGEGDLSSFDETGYSQGMAAYLGTVAGLLIRRLPIVACNSSAVFEAHFVRWAWEPAVDEQAGTWIQQGRLDLQVFQTVTDQTPVPEV